MAHLLSFAVLVLKYVGETSITARFALFLLQNIYLEISFFLDTVYSLLSAKEKKWQQQQQYNSGGYGGAVSRR